LTDTEQKTDKEEWCQGVISQSLGSWETARATCGPHEVWSLALIATRHWWVICTPAACIQQWVTR